MAGHSKWANIKHRKARQDAVRGKAWSKCSRAIIVAAKNGGSDPTMNLALRYAIDEAKSANMPKDTIEKAVKKGSGDLEGINYEEVRYEGYGPNGVAVMIDCLTDNVNRTAPEVRKIFEKVGGKLGVNGSVAFGFSQWGVIILDDEKINEDQLMEVALEAGAEDLEQESDGTWQIRTEPKIIYEVREALIAAGFEPVSAKVTMIPQTTVLCEGKAAQKIIRMMDMFEEHDDVQDIHANFDIPESELEKLDR